MKADIADKIIAECSIAFSVNSEDCNKFVKAVATPFFEPDLFTGPSMSADTIIEEMNSASEWTSLGKSHSIAISKAKNGKFVVAGMTSTELSAGHGHLAVVVGRDGQVSGNVTVPLCYAGSLNPSARVQNKRVSETFPAKMAREGKINYFAKDVETVPAGNAVDRLSDYVDGVRSGPILVPVKKEAGASWRKPQKRSNQSKKRAVKLKR